MPKRKPTQKHAQNKLIGKASLSTETPVPSDTALPSARSVPPTSINPSSRIATISHAPITAQRESIADLQARTTEVLHTLETLRSDLAKAKGIVANESTPTEAAQRRDQSKALNAIAEKPANSKAISAEKTIEVTQNCAPDVALAQSTKETPLPDKAMRFSGTDKAAEFSTGRQGPTPADEDLPAREWCLTSESRIHAGQEEVLDPPYVFGPGVRANNDEDYDDTDSNVTIEMFCAGSLESDVLDPKGVCRTWLREFLTFDPRMNMDLCELGIAIRQAFEWSSPHVRLDPRQWKALILDDDAIPEARTYQLDPDNIIVPAIRWSGIPEDKRIHRFPFQEVPTQVIRQALKLSGIPPRATARLFIKMVTVRDEGATMAPSSLWLYYLNSYNNGPREDYPFVTHDEFYECIRNVYPDLQGFMITNECAYLSGLAPRLPIGKAEDLKASYQRARYEHYTKKGDIPAEPTTPFAAALRKYPLSARARRAPDLWANKIRRADAYTVGRVVGEAQEKQQQVGIGAPVEAAKKEVEKLAAQQLCKCPGRKDHLPACPAMLAFNKIQQTYGVQVANRALLRRLEESGENAKDIKIMSEMLDQLDIAEREFNDMEDEAKAVESSKGSKGKGKAEG